MVSADAKSKRPSKTWLRDEEPGRLWPRKGSLRPVSQAAIPPLLSLPFLISFSCPASAVACIQLPRNLKDAILYSSIAVEGFISVAGMQTVLANQALAAVSFSATAYESSRPSSPIQPAVFFPVRTFSSWLHVDIASEVSFRHRARYASPPLTSNEVILNQPRR